MKKQFKILAMILCVMLVFSGCGKVETEKCEKLSVITTIFAPYDFVRQIAGDKVDLKMLLPPGGEVHSYEPSPKDAIDVSNCDLFIYVGGENDEWVEKMLSGMENVVTLKLLDTVDLLEEEVKEGMNAHDDEHEHEEEADDHVWTSPKNAQKISKAIAKQLCSLDKDNEKAYRENLNSYLKKLDKIDREIRNIVEISKRKTLVFGDRFPVRYFTEEYGLDYFAAFPGCSASVEANPKTVKFLIDKIREEKIPVVLYIELSNKKMARVLAEETGAKMMLFHSAHNVTADEFESGVTYTDIMERNIETLREALS